jgi:hypothetical protein
MKPEQQVCSLELAKRLKELGVKQESYFTWLHPNITYPAGNTNTRWLIHHGLFNTEPYEKIDDSASAFTVAELGEMLPWRIYAKRRELFFRIYKTEKYWWPAYGDFNGQVIHDLFENTEADACAKMLIYLLENGLMKPEERAA